MTDRISFCINKTQTFNTGPAKIKPLIIADISNDRLEYVRPGKYVKTDDRLNLQIDQISIWDWDDSSKGYMMNVEKTSEYDFFEVVDINSTDKNMNKETIESKIIEFKNKLLKGIKIDKKITSQNIFFKVVTDAGGAHGILIKSNQYLFKDGIFSIKPELEPSQSYAKYGYLSNDYVVDDGIKTNFKRVFSLERNLTHTKNIMLEDLMIKAKEAFSHYLSSADRQLSFKLTDDQIKEILMKCNLDISDYDPIDCPDLETILNDENIVERLSYHISGLDPTNKIIEQFLLRNQTFEDKCKESLRSEIIEEKKNELTSIEFDIGVKEKQLTKVESAIETKKAELSKLEKLNKDIQETQIQYEELQRNVTVLKETADSETLTVLKEIFGSCPQSQNYQMSSVPLSKQPDKKSQTNTCPDYKTFLKILKKNLMEVIDTDYNIGEISQFIGAALSLKLNIIVCNDNLGVISDSLSASFDCSLCTSVDVTDSDSNTSIKFIEDIDRKIIRVDGALNDLDYSKYFALCKNCSGHILIFYCDDKQILDSAPPEIWNYSALVDLSQCSLLRKNPSEFSNYSIDGNKAIEPVEWDYTNKLECRMIISRQQSHHLCLLKTIGNLDDNWFMKRYARQIATSNGKLSEYEDVFPDE